jgi:DNA-binding NarL/FixJ family response regulator
MLTVIESKVRFPNVALCAMLGLEGANQMKQPVRVLIADDRQATREGLQALLSLYPQVEVVGAVRNGREALRSVRECQPHLILMDMQMPVMDGVEATRRIKAQWPEVKVVALTIHPKYRTEVLAAGADAFLYKCDSPQALQDAILTQVQGASG